MNVAEGILTIDLIVPIFISVPELDVEVACGVQYRGGGEDKQENDGSYQCSCVAGAVYSQDTHKP